MTLDTLTLTGCQLDYFTGLALGYTMVEQDPFKPTTNPANLITALLQMRTLMRGANGSDDWQARADGCTLFAAGKTPNESVCRALVYRKFGTTVTLPDASGCEDLF